MSNAAREILRTIVQDVGIGLSDDEIDGKISDQLLHTEGQDRRSERNNVVWRMLNENPIEKENLAREYANCIGLSELFHERDGNTTIFVESGSTVLYVVNALVNPPLASNVRPTFKTNNNLAARLLLARGHSPYLFAGYLEKKYHGIFPFASNDAVTPESPAKARVFSTERMEYAQCRLALQSCSAMLLAASRFSFLHGPIVGSRENAIFKNSTYNACVRSLDASNHASDNCIIHLFITPQKLVAHSPENNAKALEHNGFHTFEEELVKIQTGTCFPAFDIVAPWHQSPFSRDLCGGANLNEVHDEVESQLLRDGTLAVSMGEGSFRICQVWSDLFERARLSVDVYVYCQDAMQREWVEAEIAYGRDTLHLERENFGITTGSGLIRIRIQAKGKL